MPKLRQTYAIGWNGGDLVKVTTGARDMAVAQDYADDPAMGTFAVIHSALKRTGHEVPDLDTFIDQLDEMDLLTEEGSENPTQPADYGNAPSPYPS